MNRSPREIVDGVLARVPDTAPEKEELKRRFNAILEASPIPQGSLPYTTPEQFTEVDRQRVTAICQACGAVLGDPASADWKQAVVQYLSTGV
ncbi:MAG: hypothetical protein PHH01_02695 [Patescibacteria group bacterium]|nr:hypothetical protein [Patescibacteria group bacterium]MDD5567079.1 hypothetical protein [Patescibacteria group bacterium]